MGYLRHIEACNRHDLSGYQPFFVGGERVGRVRHALADWLAGQSDLFAPAGDGIALLARFDTYDSRTRAMAAAVDRLLTDDLLGGRREEPYAVKTEWDAPAWLEIDRAAIAVFGLAAYGLHVNGYVRRDDGDMHMWVGVRAPDRLVAPGKLDNLVGGGQPAGFTLQDNLIKEAEEEAGLPSTLAMQACPTGAITYLLETESGLRPDTLFVYDLAMPADFEPRNHDGEVERFELWPLEQVAETVRETDRYKFNCNLVVIDFLIRHGYLTPDTPDYVAIVRGLHR